MTHTWELRKGNDSFSRRGGYNQAVIKIDTNLTMRAALFNSWVVEQRGPKIPR